jgi:hypothetical protein
MVLGLIGINKVFLGREKAWTFNKVYGQRYTTLSNRKSTSTSFCRHPVQLLCYGDFLL